MFCFNISIFFVALFVAMISYLIYFNAVKAKYIINNPYNKRQEVLAGRVVRGSILASDGTILAGTYTNDEGVENRYYPYGPVFSHVGATALSCVRRLSVLVFDCLLLGCAILFEKF